MSHINFHFNFTSAIVPLYFSRPSRTDVFSTLQIAPSAIAFLYYDYARGDDTRAKFLRVCLMNQALFSKVTFPFLTIKKSIKGIVKKIFENLITFKRKLGLKIRRIYYLEHSETPMRSVEG